MAHLYNSQIELLAAADFLGWPQNLQQAADNASAALPTYSFDAHADGRLYHF